MGAPARPDLRDLLLGEQLVGPDPVGPDAGGVDDVVGADLEALAGLGLGAADAVGAAPFVQHVGDLGAVHDDGPEALRLAEHRQDQARVVGLAVVEEVGGARLHRRQRGDQLLGLLARDRPVAVRRPVLRLAGVLGALAAPPPDPRGRHHVVHVQADPDPAVPPLRAQRRDQERGRVDQVRRELDQQLALEQRLADQAEVEVLQVAQAAVDHLRGAAGGALAEVASLDQRHRVAARGGIERDAGAGDAAADHDHVETGLLHRLERLVAGDHQLAISRGTRPPGRRAAARAGAAPAPACRGGAGRRSARSSGMPTAARPSGVRSTSGRAPVGREAAAVAGQQDDVGGAGGGVQVLLVLDRVAGERAGADDQGRRAVELRGRLRPGRLLQALERLRADHAEAPGVGQVVVRRPAGQVEDLLEHGAIDRLGPVGLVRPARADRLLDFHGPKRTAPGYSGSGGGRAASRPRPRATTAAATSTAISQPPEPSRRRRSSSAAAEADRADTGDGRGRRGVVVVAAPPAARAPLRACCLVPPRRSVGPAPPVGGDGGAPPRLGADLPGDGLQRQGGARRPPSAPARSPRPASGRSRTSSGSGRRRPAPRRGSRAASGRPRRTEAGETPAATRPCTAQAVDCALTVPPLSGKPPPGRCAVRR